MYPTVPAPGSDLTLNTLLRTVGLEPQGVVLLGHAPAEPAIRRVLPWLVHERPDLFENYQAIQSGMAALTLRRASRLAAFIKPSPDTAIFAGIYNVGPAEELTVEAFWEAPGLIELKTLGYEGADQYSPRLMRFQLERSDLWAPWIGRLTVTWPKGRAIVRRADNAEFHVQALHDESRFAPAMPAWQEVVLSWAQLQALPPSWRAALTHWRGVYFIFDVARQAAYVGSASGAENLLGRWRAYSETGHGGNHRLRQSRPEDLRFSILQLTSPDMARDDVVALEGSWKQRLHTRAHGLNAN